MFQKKVGEKIKTHILCSVTFFFRKSCSLWEDDRKYCRAGQTTNDNMTHTYRMLDIEGYKNTLRLCNIHCFPTATLAARTRLNVTLYYIACLVVIRNSIEKVLEQAGVSWNPPPCDRHTLCSVNKFLSARITYLDRCGWNSILKMSAYVVEQFRVSWKSGRWRPPLT
jgi:hypothetical protein